MSLFTNEEILSIRKEYDFRERNHDNSFNDMSSSLFTEHNLDATENENGDSEDLSKSTILAPFNTPDPEGSIKLNKMQNLIVSKKAIKFSSKLRELDRKYERDNNSQQDNGIYVQEVNNKIISKKFQRTKSTMPVTPRSLSGSTGNSNLKYI